MLLCPLDIICCFSSSTGITVDFVNGQQGLTVITVDEDSGSVSLLVAASEDVSFRVYPETFSSASGRRKSLCTVCLTYLFLVSLMHVIVAML